jgi:hypothetical protein
VTIDEKKFASTAAVGAVVRLDGNAAADIGGMQPVGAVAEQMSAGLGFDRVEHLPGTTYKDNSTVIIVPTRGMVHWKVVAGWQGLIPAMNQKRAMLFASGDEVGIAYNRMIEQILRDPVLSTWKYVLTLEDDNLVPPDAHVRLMESIEWGKFDAVAGLYFTKGDINMPMAYGDPAEFARTGVLDFRPRDVRAAIQQGTIMPVNGVAMGCTLYRMDLFRDIPAPWFVTLADVVDGKGPVAFTQDLYFCERAVRAGKRFAVDMRVHVGHLDTSTSIVY